MPRRPSSPPRSGRRESAGWDPFADWYRGWVGELGSEHHRRLAIPAVLSLLDLRTGDRVLDIGAGHGVLAGYVLDEGASYTGVDLSPRLIEAARRTYGKSARFHVADAADLRSVTELRPESFDAAVFLLSIQDIEQYDRAIASTAGLIVPGGRLVILMTHPSFRIPRQSGWGWDEGRKLRYRRVDGYLSEMRIPLSPTEGRRGVAFTHHRPLEAYVGALTDAGLVIDALHEIPTFKTLKRGPMAKAENAANREFPLFLAIRGRKL